VGARCSVEPDYIDPLEQYGALPPKPAVYFGWGEIPDQYGRRWDADDGESPLPTRDELPDLMLSFDWPDTAERLPPADLPALRGATVRHDVGCIIAALRGHDAGEVLQHAGAALLVALADPAAEVRVLAADVILRLRSRGWEGDAELADDLAAMLRGERPERQLGVDLDQLDSLLSGGELDRDGGFLDLETGEVLSAVVTDPGMVGEDAAVDVEADPDRWLAVPCLGSREAWEDMAAFAASVLDRTLADRLDRAISGRGAFRRFRDEIEDAGLVDRWRAFSDERRAGRARAWLADEGIRAVPPRA